MSKKRRLSKPRPPVKKRPSSPSHPNNDELVRQAAAQILAKNTSGNKPQVLYGVGESMSDALETLIEPFMPMMDSFMSLKLLLMLGIVAWNTAINGPEDREALVANLRATLPPQSENLAGVEMIDLIIDALIERKKQLYPHNQRLMIDFKLTELGDGHHISVASTPSPEMLLAAGEEE